MSVYITGDLKIPEANFRLVQLWNDGTTCWKQDGKFMRGQWQYVSDHGDLIDRDKLKHGFCVECTLYPDNCLKGDCDWDSIYHIEHAPAVIPAERSEEC